MSASRDTGRGPAPHVRLLSAAYALAGRHRLLERRWFRIAYARAYFAYKRRLEDPFAGLVRARPELFRGGGVVDVGANIGYTAQVFCSALEPDGVVYAFEPDPQNVAMLRENLSAPIAAGRVLVVEAAVGAATGTAVLVRNPRHPGDHRVLTDRAGHEPGASRVAIVSLDGYFEGRAAGPLCFIKLDVQGYELEVCRGMHLTLERHPRAAIAIEYSPSESAAMGLPPEDLLGFFRERGFRMEILPREGRPIPWDEARLSDVLARRGYANLLCTRTGSRP